MKKLFGRDKPRVAKVRPASRDLATGLTSNSSEELHSQYHSHNPSTLRRAGSQMLEKGREHSRSSSEERWEVVSPYYDATLPNPRHDVQSASRTSSFVSLPPGASPPIPSPLPPRSSSPFSVVSHPLPSPNIIGNQRDRERDTSQAILRKKSPASVAALGILKALEPQNEVLSQPRSRSEEHLPVSSPTTFKEKEKKSFWERSIVKDRERDAEKDKDRRDDETPAELTRMIGYLTATASEDWSLVLEVCERASANDVNAKEAVRALRREFKYGEPSAQLSAARLWAIMLRNSSDTFISQSTSRKFLDSIEDIIMSSHTSPVVRERLMDVVAAAAFASSTKSQDFRGDKDNFRGLWKRVKPMEKPDEGIPFDTHDAMFNPPAPRSSPSSALLSGQAEPPPLSADLSNPPPISRKRKPSITRNGIIPLKEDIRRLFQECKFGRGNASLLSESLAFAKPEDLSKDIIQEFHLKCRSSQELIFAQIPWASAGAERSRLARNPPGKTKPQPPFSQDKGSSPAPDEETIELTTQEQLLAELLDANEVLLEALRVYDDLESMAIERQTEEKSRKDIGMLTLNSVDDFNSQSTSVDNNMGFSSHMTEPDIASHLVNLPSSQITLAALAPPPPAPHGPRLPLQISSSSRTPSPVPPDLQSLPSSPGTDHGQLKSGMQGPENEDTKNPEYEAHTNIQEEPSAKALGKRKVIESDRFHIESNLFHDPRRDEPYVQVDQHNSDIESMDSTWRQHVQYVYDAAAERTQQRIRERQFANS